MRSRPALSKRRRNKRVEGLLAAAVVLTLARAVAACPAEARTGETERRRAQPVATCSIPGDPQERRWTLERGSSSASDPLWQVVFKSRALGRPQAELRLLRAQPVIAADAVTLSFHSANGGRTVEWRAKAGRSTIDIYVNFGLEVNVEPDLDPVVEQMNTNGPLDLDCALPPSLAMLDQSPVGETGSEAHSILSSEWIIGGGAAWGIRLFQSKGDRWYALQTASWGRELTGDLGPGALRGRFVWAAEATPLFAQTHPTRVYGVGIAPVVWRWNFVPRPRWSAFGEMAMGGLWSSAPVPEQTQRANFTAHWGAGVRLHTSPRRSIVVAYRLQHISNGNQLLTNPGVNSHVLFVGWSVKH